MKMFYTIGCKVEQVNIVTAPELRMCVFCVKISYL